jgi:hypothetical protein
VISALALVAIALSLGAALYSGDWSGLFLNLGAEFAGAVVIYLLIELLIERREGRESRKEELILQLGSKARDVATAASEELRRRGWLFDGSLRGAYLYWANLSGAYLYKADLQGVMLNASNLEESSLVMANLQGASLQFCDMKDAFAVGANLQNASLIGADLHGANLGMANLRGADLCSANLKGTCLSWANLLDATLISDEDKGHRVQFDKHTILPDGKTWTRKTDLTRFTDASHPEFWNYEEQLVQMDPGLNSIRKAQPGGKAL